MKISLILVFIGISINAFGQKDSVNNLYAQAIEHYNSYLEKAGSTKKQIFIEENNGITENLKKKVGKREIAILTWENQRAVYKENDNKLTHVRIFPAQVKGDLVEVHMTPYGGQYLPEKNTYNLGLSDWVVIQFKFDCTAGKIIYSGTKTGGI